MAEIENRRVHKNTWACGAYVSMWVQCVRYFSVDFLYFERQHDEAAESAVIIWLWRFEKSRELFV